MKFKIIITVLVLIFLFAAGKVGKTLYDYWQADRMHAMEQTKFTTAGERAPIQVAFDSLLAENPEIVGWLYSDGTPINYPVVQASNNDKYLRRDLYGKYLVTGTLFVDYRNRTVTEDRNYIIYGHNMKDDSMFASLLNYQDQAYYEAHPALYYLTPHGDYKIELIAGLLIPEVSEVYTPTPQEPWFSEFLADARARSGFVSPVTLSDSDRIITLSTCSYNSKNGRYILIGKLIKL